MSASDTASDGVDARPSWTRDLVLAGAGATSSIPLLTFTVTGFSLLCLVLAVGAVRGWARRGFALPLSLASIGSMAYVVSAVINETSLTAINVPAFAALALYVCGIAVMTRNVADVVTLLGGVSVGTSVFYALFGTSLTTDAGAADLWKYGLAPSVTALVLIAVATGRRIQPIWGCVALVGLAAISIAFNFRSHALICLAAALIVAVDVRRRRPLPLVAKAALCGAVGIGSSIALTAAASAGLLGPALTAKVEMQATQNVPAVLAGRTEPPLSLTAIADRPLVGWGDANALPMSVFDDAYQLAYRWGFDLSYPLPSLWRSADGYVTLHSILLGSWAEAGLVGVLLPVWLLFAAVALIAAAVRVPRLSPLMTFLGLQAMWDLVFSPWSYNLPLVFAVITVLCVRLRGAEQPPADTVSRMRHEDFDEATGVTR